MYNYYLNHGYELISKEYKDFNSKMISKNSSGYIGIITFCNLKDGRKPRYFHSKNEYAIQNIKLWLKINNKKIELISKEYIHAKSKMKWKCLNKKCNLIFHTAWAQIQSGVGCPYCVNNAKPSKHNNLFINNKNVCRF